MSDAVGETVEPAVSELDVLPTVADLLVYEVRGGAYPGVRVREMLGLEPLPQRGDLRAPVAAPWPVGDRRLG